MRVDKYGLSGSKVVVSTRTLNPGHNVETLIRAAPLVLERTSGVKFLVVAGGSQEEYLHELAESLGVKDSIAFTGRVEEDEMVTCLQAGDVYVSTSISESGLAASTAEAMACSLPVINTDTGDIRDWIKDGEGGYVVPVENPEAIAEKIVHLIDNDEERLRAAGINRKTIEERNNVYIEMKKMEEAYLDVVAKHGEK